ncbi:MAG: GatB/YqeY domain-containing protein [Candidatus Omnitrophica bacterium]|nr:GatB/YqeY domain-containing protein [Candidatus Omnitrophota bacterium]
MIEEKILNDYKEAMKSRDSLKSTTLSSLRAKFSYEAIEKKKERLEDSDCVAVIKRVIKQHRDSIEQFTKGNRLDLAEKEKQEMGVLKVYLPPEMPADEIGKLIEEAVVSTGAQGMRDMGKVIKEVKAKAGDSADGKVISDLVKERLSKI